MHVHDDRRTPGCALFLELRSQCLLGSILEWLVNGELQSGPVDSRSEDAITAKQWNPVRCVGYAFPSGMPGQQRVVQGQGFFRMVSVTTCRTCNGRGTIPVTACKVCKGSGSIPTTESLEIKIPRGAVNNLRLRLRGKGQSFNGKTGDLYVQLIIPDDPLIKRINDDLQVVQEITFPEAALGGDRTIEIFGRKHPIKITSGTQPGDIIRVKGVGMPHLNAKGSGDLLVVMKVVVPKHLSSKQKELISALEEEGEKKHSWLRN